MAIIPQKGFSSVEEESAMSPQQIIINTVKRILGVDTLYERQRLMLRELRAISHRGSASGTASKVDRTTPRFKILSKKADPILLPAGDGWMSGAVFDGRPIVWRGQKLVYFLGQPAYRSDQQQFVGLAKYRKDGSLEPLSDPVIVPDTESRGIDIPAFATVGDNIIGVYADDFGPESTGTGLDCNYVIATSVDGLSFTKTVIDQPFSGMNYNRIGLPWLLNDRGILRLYLRAKRGDKNFLIHGILRIDEARIDDLTVASRLSHSPINIAVTRRIDRYVMFSGSTVGGGIYATVSDSPEKFDDRRRVMLVSSQSEWGWDYYKVAASPDNTEEDEVRMTYTSSRGGELLMGEASFSMSKLIESGTRRIP